MDQKKRGFTIVEIAVVISVLGIIFGIVLVSFGLIQRQARDDRRQADIMSVRGALMRYYTDEGEFPYIAACASSGCSLDNLATYLVPTYIAEIPTPPRTDDYRYFRSSSATAYDRFGLRVAFETKNTCATGHNNDPAWWSTLPQCNF